MLPTAAIVEAVDQPSMLTLTSKLADDDLTTVAEGDNGITAIVTAADPFLRMVAITTVADDDPDAAIKAADSYLYFRSMAKLADEDPDFVIDAGAEPPLLTVPIATLADDDPIIFVTASDGAFYVYAHQGESSNNSILMHNVVPTTFMTYIEKADETDLDDARNKYSSSESSQALQCAVTSVEPYPLASDEMHHCLQ